ncbi:Uncharacterized protein yhdX, partial [Bacillus altitudinis]
WVKGELEWKNVLRPKRMLKCLKRLSLIRLRRKS